MAAISVSAIVMIYYNVIIAWALRFFIASLTDHLPWEDCDSCQCLLYRQDLSGNATGGSTLNETVLFLLTNNSYGLNCSEYTAITVSSLLAGW